MYKKKILILVVVLILAIICISVFIFIKKPTELITYELVDTTNEFAMESKERNYKIITKNNSYYLVINNGEESAYYSKLEVVEVRPKANSIKVFVKLPDEEGIGEAFSYPQAVIKLNKNPKFVKIVYLPPNEI